MEREGENIRLMILNVTQTTSHCTLWGYSLWWTGFSALVSSRNSILSIKNKNQACWLHNFTEEVRMKGEFGDGKIRPESVNDWFKFMQGSWKQVSDRCWEPSVVPAWLWWIKSFHLETQLGNPTPSEEPKQTSDTGWSSGRFLGHQLSICDLTPIRTFSLEFLKLLLQPWSTPNICKSYIWWGINI